jgi:hypothetical protein
MAGNNSTRVKKNLLLGFGSGIAKTLVGEEDVEDCDTDAMFNSCSARSLPMPPTRFRFGLLALVVLLWAATPSFAGVIVTQNPGIPQGTLGVQGESVNFITTGATMAGMQITAIFADLSSQTVTWVATPLVSPTSGGAFGTGWSVTASNNTFPPPPVIDPHVWTITNTRGVGLTELIFDGGPGRTVFDRAITPPFTPGAGLGLDFSTDQFNGLLPTDTITATYRDVVSIPPAAPVGDIFRTLDLVFQNSATTGFASGRTLSFEADTDTTTSDIFPLPIIPEPGSLLLFGVGALGLVGYRRWRRKQAA